MVVARGSGRQDSPLRGESQNSGEKDESQSFAKPWGQLDDMCRMFCNGCSDCCKTICMTWGAIL